MVLRFNCPCGAPYTLADHLAGRTFTCPTCGVVLKIGNPADAPPPPAAPLASAPPAAPAASMEWGAKDSGPGLEPLDESEIERPAKTSARIAPGSGGGKAGKAKDAQLGLADEPPLALADDEPGADEDGEDGEGDPEGVYNSLDEDEPRPKKGGARSGAGKAGAGRSGQGKTGSARVKKSATSDKLKASSANLRTSGVAKGAGKGASGRQAPRGRSAEDHPAASAPAVRGCPVCDTRVPAAAVSCPSCGVRLKERSALEKMVAGGAWKGPLKSLVMLGLAGGIGYGAWSFMEREKKPDRPQLVRVPPSTTTGTPTESTPPTTTPPRADTGKAPAVTEPPPSAPTERRPRPGGAGEHAGGADTVEIVIPEGPLRADFERLRDAPDDGPALGEAIAALAAKPGLAEAMGKALSSVDDGFLVRLHRTRLAAGDAAQRRKVIEASLKAEPSSIRLFFTVVAALELDREGLAPQLQALTYDGNQLLARTWLDAALERTPPRGGGLEALSGALPRLDAESARLVAPAMVLGGDGRGLRKTLEALEHGDELLRGLAQAGLEKISAGTGPTGGDLAAWRTWVDAYLPARELMARACTDPAKDLGELATGRRELMARATEVIPFLPVLMEDAAVRTTAGAQTVGDLLAAHGAAHPSLVKKLLAGLGMDRARSGGVWIVRGALFSCDDAVAEEAVAAVVRGVVPLDEAALHLPDLVRPAGSRPQEALSAWIEGLGTDRRSLTARLVAASFRCNFVETWLLNTAQADEPGFRENIGARLGSSKLESRLLQVLKEGGKGPPGFPAPPAALYGLAEFGTEDAADELVRLAVETGNHDYYRIVGWRLADYRHARRLKKLVDSTMDANIAPHIFECYGRLAGRDASPALAKRCKPDDPMAVYAVPILLKCGGKEARELARKPFLGITPTDSTLRTTLDEVEALARSGTPEDGALLGKLFPNFEQLRNRDRWAVLVAMGRLGWEEGKGLLHGYVFQDHTERGAASVALALLGDEAAVPRMKEVALRPKAVQFAEPDAALVVAALATLDPVAGQQVATAYLPAIISKAREEEAVPIAFALARVGDNEGLTKLARSTSPAIRAFTARGIAMAARSSPNGMSALAVIEDLRFDPELNVRAEIAVARGLLNLEGAPRDIVSALCGPDDLLNVVYGAATIDGPRALLAHLSASAELANLRAALWSAYDVCTPGDPPGFRPEMTRGRHRELARKARGALLR